MAVKIITHPTSEPVDLLNDVKPHLRLYHSEEDAYLAGRIRAARQHVEWVLTKRALITQTLELTLRRWPDSGVIRLPQPPLQSVTHIKYIDSSNTEHIIEGGDLANYIIDTDSEPGEITPLTSWPSVTLRKTAAIKVRYVAGYASAADIPEPLIQGLLMLVGHFYENREIAVVGTSVIEIPFTVKALCEPLNANPLGVDWNG